MYTIDFNELDKKLLNPKKFRLSDYISQGYDLFRKDYGSFIVAFLGMFVIGMIPFCQFLGLGNFFKACERIEKGEKVSFGDMFDFDKVGLYIIHYLVIMGCFAILFVPFYAYIIIASQTMQESGNQAFPFIIIILYFVMVIAMILLTTVTFFMSPLIAFSNETSYGKIFSYAWKFSKKYFLWIVLFSFVVGMIGTLGVIVCYIGLFFTLPLSYCMYFMCYKDLVLTETNSEINEIKGI